MKYPLKPIEWHDAFNGNHHWCTPESLPDKAELVLTQTVGFEIKRDNESVTLAMSISDQGMLCDLFTIPLAVAVREQTFRSRLT